MSYTNASQSVLDIADLTFLRLQKIGHAVETIKLQKLLYYSQGWSLALRSQPLFMDEIQAWRHGPVVASLYGFHRGDIVLNAPIRGGVARRLPEPDQEFVNCVIDAYGDMSGWDLRNRTHLERPWIDAWAESNQGAVRGVEITRDSMSSYFSERDVPAALVGYKQWA